MSNKIEIADVVKHVPSGERWTVARVDDVYVWPCGWPESRALKRDCVLLEKANTEEKNALIENLKKIPYSDPRCFYRHEQANKV